jgi:hypothetical protein
VSLTLWTLFLITTVSSPLVKYVNFAMRMDYDGEGGIIALTTRAQVMACRSYSSWPSPTKPIAPERWSLVKFASCPNPSPDQLGSGLIDHSQNMTAAAMQIAEK